MSLQDCKAVYGLTGIGTNSRTNVTGSATVGIGQTSMQFPLANEGYSMRAIFASGGEMTLNPMTGDTTGSDTWTAGAAQVETATIVAASGATSSGNLSLVVTINSAPTTVNVPLVAGTHTTAALIAEACRETLAANTTVSSLYEVGGSGASITLTRKPVTTFTVPVGTLPIYVANDSTLNILIPTALGVTGASTSTNTTAGVASAGVKLYDHEVNFEGNPINEIFNLYGFMVKSNFGSTVTYTDGAAYVGYLTLGQVSICAGVDGLPNAGDIVFTADTESDINITVVGESA